LQENENSIEQDQPESIGHREKSHLVHYSDSDAINHASPANAAARRSAPMPKRPARTPRLASADPITRSNPHRRLAGAA
jgi:hypothetical protein